MTLKGSSRTYQKISRTGDLVYLFIQLANLRPIVFVDNRRVGLSVSKVAGLRAHSILLLFYDLERSAGGLK